MPKSVQEYLKEPYARILIPDEQGGYTAEILELSGCFAEGETADETMQALDRAADSWIQAACDAGQEIPSPFMNQGYSGKIALRLPRSLHRQATQFAARDGVSLNQFLVSAIAARIGAEEAYTRLVAQLYEKLEDRLCMAVNRATINAIANCSSHVGMTMTVSLCSSTLSNLYSGHTTMTEAPCLVGTSTRTFAVSDQGAAWSTSGSGESITLISATSMVYPVIDGHILSDNSGILALEGKAITPMAFWAPSRGIVVGARNFPNMHQQHTN